MHAQDKDQPPAVLLRRTTNDDPLIIVVQIQSLWARLVHLLAL